MSSIATLDGGNLIEGGDAEREHLDRNVLIEEDQQRHQV